MAALVLGAALRFIHLGTREFSPDEGASWAAASAPSISEVVARQAIVNPGKLAIHDLMLHAWMTAFGQSLFAMRALSALLGTLSILLAFFVAREMFAEDEDSLLIAAISALMFAVNLVVIKYAREVRMYPVMLAAILGQVGFFLRALRRGGLANLAALAILTAVGVGANFSAMLVPLTEGIWLLYVLGAERFSIVKAGARRAWASAIALTLGGLILVPKILSAFGKTAVSKPGGIIYWIKSPPWFAPLAFFNKATGSFAYPVLALLAVWGIYRGWGRGQRRPVAFALLWMWAPLIMLMIVSYALTPIFVERYAMSSFVPFFILIALGICEVPRRRLQAAALIIAVALALGHVWAYGRKPHDTQYVEAIAAARASLKPGETMTAVPGYAIEVLRYYMPADEQSRAVNFDSPSGSSASVIIVADQNLTHDVEVGIRHNYPIAVAQVRGAVVLRK